MEQFQWNQPLVVVHAHDCVVFPLGGLMKETIRGKRSVGLNEPFSDLPNRRQNRLSFLIPENSILPGVRIQTCDGDPRTRDPEPLP
jgi:hypothetical protein